MEEVNNNEELTTQIHRPPTRDKHVSIKTLADLITACRHRGYQVFNDKVTVPESDKLQVLPAHYYDPKAHRSDDLDPRWQGSSGSSRRSRRRRSSFRSSASRFTGQSGGSDLPYKSSVSSPSSRVQSEYSSNTCTSSGRQTGQDRTTIDFPGVEGDIEAEKILRMRMLKKSRRHKETTTSLFDVIKMKQRQLKDMYSDKLSSGDQIDVERQSENTKIFANGDVNREHNNNVTEHIKNSTQAKHTDMQIVNDHIETSDNHLKQDISGKENVIGNGENQIENKNHVETDRDSLENVQQDHVNKVQNHSVTPENAEPQEEEIVGEISKDDDVKQNETHTQEKSQTEMEVKCESEKTFDIQSPKLNHLKHNYANQEQQNNTNEEKVTLESESPDKSKDSSTPNEKKGEAQTEQADPITEVQEYVIQEGDTKLVLYRLKTKTSLLQDINNQDSNISNRKSDRESITRNSIIKNSDNHQRQCNNSNIDQANNGVLNAGVSTDRSIPPEVSGSNNHINNSCAEDGDNHNQVTDLQQPHNHQLISNSEHNGLLSDDNKTQHCSDISEQSCDNHDKQVSSLKDDKSHLNNCTPKPSADAGDNKAKIDLREFSNKDNEINSDNSNDHDREFYDENRSELETMDAHGSNGNSDENSTNRHENNKVLDNVGGDLNMEDKNSESNSTKDSQILNDKNDDLNVSDTNIDSSVTENSKDVVNNKHDENQSNKTQQSESLDSAKSSVPKRPKRSLGNGFLVSSDVEDDDEDEKRENDHIDANDESKQSDDSKVPVEDKKVKPKKVRTDGDNQPSTSGRQSETSDSEGHRFKAAASQVLIASRIRQTFDEERERRASYVKEIGETRKALREMFRKLKNGESFETDKDMDAKNVHVKSSGDDKGKGDADTDKESKVENNDVEQLNEDSKKPAGKGQRLPNDSNHRQEGDDKDARHVNDTEESGIQINDAGQSDADINESQNESANSIQSGLKSSSCVSSGSSSTGKKYEHVEKKVDNQWDPNHPLYEQIRTGFKSQYRKPDTKTVNKALKSLRGDYLDTTQVSPDNEYLKEAKRIYPKGFKDSPKTTKKSNKHSSILNEKESIKQSDPSKRYSGDKLAREATVYGKMNTHSDIEPKNIPSHRPKSVKRKTKQGNKENSDTNENSKTSTPRKKLVSQPKQTTTSNNIDVEEEKLKRERNRIKKYQKMADTSSELPKVTSNGIQSHTKYVSTKIRNTSKPNGKIPQAKFSSYKNGDNNNNLSDDSADEECMLTGDNDSVTIATRQSAKAKLARRASERSMGMDTRSEDVPITQAVEIVRSRQKFYNDDKGEIQTRQREHRVYKLFREIQMIRKSADDVTTSVPLVTEYPDVPGAAPFLMMDYDFSRTTVSSHKTDTDLHNFLYGSLDYNMCFKSRSLHPYSRKRDRAWNDLRQKLENRLMFSSNLK